MVRGGGIGSIERKKCWRESGSGGHIPLDPQVERKGTHTDAREREREGRGEGGLFFRPERCALVPFPKALVKKKLWHSPENLERSGTFVDLLLCWLEWLNGGWAVDCRLSACGGINMLDEMMQKDHAVLSKSLPVSKKEGKSNRTDPVAR